MFPFLQVFGNREREMISNSHSLGGNQETNLCVCSVLQHAQYVFRGGTSQQNAQHMTRSVNVCVPRHPESPELLLDEVVGGHRLGMRFPSLERL